MIKHWPKKRSKTIKSSALIEPIKKYISSRYRLIRRNQNTPSLLDDCYNFGKEELKYLPDIDVFFSEKYEKRYETKGVSPFDMALFAVFALGVEQGRRSERQQTFSEQMLHKFLVKRTEDIKALKKRIEELEAEIQNKPPST